MSYERHGKRVLDLALAIMLSLPVVIVCLLCAALVKIESPGPAIFRQVRIGQDRQPFILYKLRTMPVDTGDLASHEVSDRQVSKLGLILRRLKLDELPQLLNVLGGSMSLVGPRPCLPTQVVLIEERDKRGVFRLRPGITGPAQLAGIDMSTPLRLAEADAVYLDNCSPMRDIQYIALTGIGRGRGDAVGRARDV